MTDQTTIEKIQTLWNEGKTIDQIAHRLHSTRGKISGLMNRAKKSGMFFSSHKTDTAMREKRVVRDKKVKEKLARKPLSFDNEIIKLKYAECRFIVNEDMSNPTFCKQPIRRVSYCADHAMLCYVKPKDKRK